MGITLRYYIFQDDGALRRIPKRVSDALPFGKDAIPEYAGTRQVQDAECGDRGRQATDGGAGQPAEPRNKDRGDDLLGAGVADR